MARIAGVDLPRDKRVEVGLTYIFGIGLSSSQEILKKTGINPDTRVRDLTEDEVQKIREVIGSEYKVEGDLRREGAMNVKRLIEINSYRGKRHRAGLPVRGQRSKTNARTRKGPRKAIAGKKTGINPDTRVRDLTEDEVQKIREVIGSEYKVEGDLRREGAMNVKRLIEINSYRGKRHRAGLPVRGQRSKTNARTRKGPRKAIAGKKK